MEFEQIGIKIFMVKEKPPDFSGGLRVSYTRSPIRWCCRGGS